MPVGLTLLTPRWWERETRSRIRILSILPIRYRGVTWQRGILRIPKRSAHVGLAVQCTAGLARGRLAWEGMPSDSDDFSGFSGPACNLTADVQKYRRESSNTVLQSGQSFGRATLVHSSSHYFTFSFFVFVFSFTFLHLSFFFSFLCSQTTNRIMFFRVSLFFSWPTFKCLASLRMQFFLKNNVTR